MGITKTTEMTAELNHKKNKIKLEIIGKQINNLINVLESENNTDITKEEMVNQLLAIADFVNRD